MALAHVEEAEGRLIVTQSNGPVLRNLQNIARNLLGNAVPLLVWYILFPKSVISWCRVMLTDPGAGMMILFIILFVLAALFESVNRFFGRETFIFNRNEGVFIRNGFTVGPLRQIRAVTAQVTANGQYPMFRLILELPRSETVTIVRTHDIPREGEFRLSGNIFSNLNKRFAAYTPWLNYDEQNLVPFLPPEIMALREKISQYVGTQAAC